MTKKELLLRIEELDEIEAIVQNTMNGFGNLNINKKILILVKLLENKYGYTTGRNRRTITHEFLSYFYENRLQFKWDRNKSALRTFIPGCVKNFLLQEVRKLKQHKKTFVSLSSWISEGLPEDMFKGDDGVWRMKSEIIDFCDWYDNTKKDPETIYLQRELLEYIIKFTLTKYGIIYLDLFYGNINQTQAADELKVARRTIIRWFDDYKIELLQHLKENGYDGGDLADIFA